MLSMVESIARYTSGTFFNPSGTMFEAVSMKVDMGTTYFPPRLRAHAKDPKATNIEITLNKRPIVVELIHEQ